MWQALKEQVATGQLRYYEPVPQSVPGIQCQVDPGELRGVLIGGQERTVDFVVFVLSCSRLMYVGVALKPLDTAAFIQLHDEACVTSGARLRNVCTIRPSWWC